MRLANSSSNARRSSVLSSMAVGRLGRYRSARKFPAEAERLVTPAELKRLYA